MPAPFFRVRNQDKKPVRTNSCCRLALECMASTALLLIAQANFDPPGAAMQWYDSYKEKVREFWESWTLKHKLGLLEAGFAMKGFEEIRQRGLLERTCDPSAAVCISLFVLLHVGLKRCYRPLSSCWCHERRREALGRNLR
jgi:hypothetical protein